MNEGLDEQGRQLMEKIAKLPRQYREWLYIAACDPDPEYQAMIQTITKENVRQWLKEIREIFANARKASDYKRAANAPTVQSEALTATKTTASGRYGDYTTAAARNQEGRNGNE